MTHSSASLPSISTEPLLAGITVAAAGVMLTSAASLAASTSAVRLALGVLASCGAGWLTAAIARTSRDLRPSAVPEFEALPDSCREVVAGIIATAGNGDAAFRQLWAARMAQLSEQVREWSQGRFTFTGIESWRTAYETVLASPDITDYRSVAWLKSGEYWQDLPGKQGMQFNFELLDRGVRIERLLILGWNLWPPELSLPHASIRRWIDEQHYRGVSVLLVRECDLMTEQDLLRDFGIYGERAVGELHSDDYSRTVSFTLSFDPAAVRLAQEHWARLKLFSRPYQETIEPPALLR